MKQPGSAEAARHSGLSGPRGVLGNGTLGARWQEARFPGVSATGQLGACLPCPDSADLGLGQGRGPAGSSGGSGRGVGKGEPEAGAGVGHRAETSPRPIFCPPPRFCPCPGPRLCQAPPGSLFPPSPGKPAQQEEPPPPNPFLVWHQPTLPASSVPEISPRESPGPLPAPAPPPQAPTVKTLIARASTSSDPPCAAHCP